MSMPPLVLPLGLPVNPCSVVSLDGTTAFHVLYLAPMAGPASQVTDVLALEGSPAPGLGPLVYWHAPSPISTNIPLVTGPVSEPPSLPTVQPVFTTAAALYLTQLAGGYSFPSPIVSNDELAVAKGCCLPSTIAHPTCGPFSSWQDCCGQVHPLCAVAAWPLWSTSCPTLS